MILARFEQGSLRVTDDPLLPSRCFVTNRFECLTGAARKPVKIATFQA